MPLRNTPPATIGWSSALTTTRPLRTCCGRAGCPSSNHAALASRPTATDYWPSSGDHIALLEDDHVPTGPGWLDPYVAALDAGVVGVVWRLGDASGEIVHRAGPIVWRPGLGCPLVVMARSAHQRVGAWNQAAFGERYGYDDAEWAVRAYRAGLIGPYRGLWPGIDDRGQSIVDLPHPPSSDGKSAEQRRADVAVNVGLLGRCDRRQDTGLVTEPGVRLMPVRPPRPCTAPGCTALVVGSGSRCRVHTLQRERERGKSGDEKVTRRLELQEWSNTGPSGTSGCGPGRGTETAEAASRARASSRARRISVSRMKWPR